MRSQEMKDYTELNKTERGQIDGQSQLGGSPLSSVNSYEKHHDIGQQVK